MKSCLTFIRQTMILRIWAFVLPAALMLGTGASLKKNYDYIFFTPAQIFDLGREFNRSSLEVSSWLSEKADNDTTDLFVRMYAPNGTLLNYYSNESANLHFKSQNFWVSWHSLFPSAPDMCERTKKIGTSEFADELYMKFGDISFAPKVAFRSRVNAICSSDSQNTVAFAWLQKSKRYTSFDCYNNVNNEKNPPTFGSCSINFATQEAILDHLRKGELVAVGSRFFFLTEFFDAHPALAPVFEADYGLGDKAKVYTVLESNPPTMDDFSALRGKHISAFFDGFAKANPDRYLAFKENVLADLFTMNTPEQIHNFLNNDNECFIIKNRDYSVTTKCEKSWKKMY